MREAVIVSGARTAIGGFGGALKDVPAIDLAALVIRETLKRANLRPALSAAMQDAAPDALKNQGRIDLEKKAGAWNGDARPVARGDEDTLHINRTMRAGSRGRACLNCRKSRSPGGPSRLTPKAA